MSEDTLPDLELAGQFPTLTLDDWQGLAAKALNRGRPEGRQLDADAVRQALTSHLVGGLDIDPLYEVDEVRPLGRPGFMPFTRGGALRDPQQAWDVRVLHDGGDREATRDAVLLDLERGATSVWVEVGAAGVAPADLGYVLKDVMLDLAPVVVSSQDDQVAAADALVDVITAAEQTGVAHGNLGIDPVSLSARTGTPVDLSPVAAQVQRCRADLPGLRALVVDTRAVHEAGASDVDELAIAVATGVAYLRALEEAGIATTSGARHLEFRLVATADQFTTIAKFRALRRVWARVCEACGVPEPDRAALLHAVTSYRMSTRDDAWNNMLRGTVACFAAAVGGAEAITVLPFDTVAGVSDVLGRRVARNTQIVLAEESNLGRVTDPAGGSAYVEALTGQLAVKAWQQFQQFERTGGVVQALDSGALAARLEQTRAERDERLASRALPITGVSMFPNVEEQPLTRRARPVPATAGLPARRDSVVFEELRDRAAGAPADAVALVNLGTRRDFGAREGFAANVLGVAGLPVRRVEAATAADVTAALAAGQVPTVAVVCSSPGVNAVEGPAAVTALREAGVKSVYLAGKATELGNDTELGDDTTVDGTLFDGMDVVAVLGEVLDTLGVAR